MIGLTKAEQDAVDGEESIDCGIVPIVNRLLGQQWRLANLLESAAAVGTAEVKALAGHALKILNAETKP